MKFLAEVVKLFSLISKCGIFESISQAAQPK